ncbi:MAG: nickel pincer cofactor biosynthesis protein LarB [Actinobacteria bacterium]|nr:nickel pincer cofactor biosynthesis protein LarB [Actinomycetota bacterium]
MRPEELKDLLTAMKDGSTSIDEAVRALQDLPISDLGFAQLDTHRELRQGLPEAIYAAGKTTDEVVAIARNLLDHTSGPVLATRTPPETAAGLIDEFPFAIHHERARLVVLRADQDKYPDRPITVVAAGTSDLPVAEEAFFACGAFGLEVTRITDAGAAGLHRILAVQDRLRDATAVIVVAGMEGALATIVGGLTAAPVIAVPTSVGYGSSFEGLAALLAMLNSCAAGVTVTNIDNGFGAAAAALRLVRAAS